MVGPEETDLAVLVLDDLDESVETLCTVQHLDTGRKGSRG
jgi:hypothetical protein